MSTHQTAARARAAVSDAITDRGGRAREIRVGRRTEILATTPGSSTNYGIRVLSRTKGDWQTSIAEGALDAPEDPTRVWVLVDFTQTRARFFVIPEHWIRRDIAGVTEEYFRRHGGTRAENPDSVHHKIETARVEDWRGRWDLLGLPLGT